LRIKHQKPNKYKNKDQKTKQKINKQKPINHNEKQKHKTRVKKLLKKSVNKKLNNPTLYIINIETRQESLLGTKPRVYMIFDKA
jgi:hypothetical protein